MWEHILGWNHIVATSVAKASYRPHNCELTSSIIQVTYALNSLGKTQNMGKERENVYWKKEISGGKAHTNTRKLVQNILMVTDVFLNQKRVNVCVCFPKAEISRFSCDSFLNVPTILLEISVLFIIKYIKSIHL